MTNTPLSKPHFLIHGICIAIIVLLLLCFGVYGLGRTTGYQKGYDTAYSEGFDHGAGKMLTVLLNKQVKDDSTVMKVVIQSKDTVTYYLSHNSVVP